MTSTAQLACGATVITEKNTTTCSDDTGKHDVCRGLGIDIDDTCRCTLDICCRPDLRRRDILGCSNATPLDRLLHVRSRFQKQRHQQRQMNAEKTGDQVQVNTLYYWA